MGRALRVGLAALLLLPAMARAGVEVRGVVRDAETGAVLPRANIAVVGQGWGTFGDETGAFRVAVEALPVLLRATHVGYAEAELWVRSADPVEFSLQPVALEIEGLTVDYRDPALRIMREVIRRKAAWAPLVRNYRVEAQTRQVLYENQSVAAVRESLAEIYHDRDKGLREQVKSRAHTANITDSLQVFAAAKYLIDLYADETVLHGQALMGPTHPQALERYRFQLTEQEGDLFHIAVRPRDPARAGWTGSLTVKDREYALVAARLQLNRRLYPARLATANGLGYRVGQRFARLEPGVWLPVAADYEIEGRVGATAVGEQVNRLRSDATPRALLRGWTWFRDYEINQERVRYAFEVEREWLVEPPAPTWDKIFARRRSERPPDREGARAYAELRPGGTPLAARPSAWLLRLHQLRPAKDIPAAISADPLAQQSLVSGRFLRNFIANSTGIDVDSTLSFLGRHLLDDPEAARGKFAPELWANRVEALHLGLRWSGENLRGRRLGLYAKGGYDTGPGRFFAGAGLRRAWGAAGRGFSGFMYQRGTVASYPSAFYDLADNSLPFLLTFDDYFDFYWRWRWRAESGYRFAERHSLLTVGVNRERHRSVRKEVDRKVLCDFTPEHGHVYRHLCIDRDPAYRDNPPIRAGDLTALDVELDLGGLDPKAWRRARLKAEYSDKWMGSFARFGRVDAQLDAHAAWRRVGWWPAEANYRLAAGWGWGAVPPQRRGALDAGLMIFAPFGAFRTLRHQPYVGRSYAGFFWEQRWRSGLFQRLGLGRRAWRWGLGWAVHGAAGRIWGDGPDPVHRELGLSLTVLDYLNLNYTRRFDKRGWYWGVSASKAF